MVTRRQHLIQPPALIKKDRLGVLCGLWITKLSPETETQRNSSPVAATEWKNRGSVFV